jgi:hypothetical protein
MSIRYVDAAGRTGLQTLPCDPDRIARGFRSNERFFILPRSEQIRPVFRVWTGEIPRTRILMGCAAHVKFIREIAVQSVIIQW